MVGNEIIKQTLQKAIDVVGSPEGVAFKLGISISTLKRWKAGTSEPTYSQYEKLLEIIKEKEHAA